MRTPISFACCSTTYDSTLNRPDTVSTSASPPKTTVTQKAIRSRYVCIPAIVRRVMIAKRGIDAREAFEQRLARLLGVAADAQHQRRPGALGTGRQVHAPEREQVAERDASRSRTTPTTVNVRDGSTRSRSGERRWTEASRRTTCPTPSRFGQSWRAMVSDTTTTPASAVRSAGVKPRPLTTIDAEHIEVFGRHGHLARPTISACAATADGRFDRLHASAATTRPRPPPTDAAVTAWSSAARRGFVGDGDHHRVARPHARIRRSRRRRHLAEIWRRRSGGAPMRRPGRRSGHCRARRGRASLVTSPRIVRTSSRRVACSAGASPKNTVETDGASHQEHQHPPVRGRGGQVQQTHDLRRSSGGIVVVTA